MPQQIEGRHRRNPSARHRVARSPIGLPLAGGRGRSTVLAAALGAALVTGVAGGTAAAATHHGPSGPSDATSTADPSDATGATSTADPTAAPGLPPGALDLLSGAGVAGASDLAPAEDQPAMPPATGRHVTTGISAVPVQLKTVQLKTVQLKTVQLKTVPIPASTMPTAAPGAKWVNPNPTARVTSCFGERWGRLHAGVDLAAPDGTPIVAAGAGVVVRAGEAEGYGNAILIDHGNGYLTHYGHLSVIGVEVGQHVEAGEQIGNEGSTGHSTGPHLHFEVHQGYYQNPIEPTRWMHEHGVDIPGCVTFTDAAVG